MVIDTDRSLPMNLPKSRLDEILTPYRSELQTTNALRITAQLSPSSQFPLRALLEV